jgi:glucose-6-phosphate 1-epimerase
MTPELQSLNERFQQTPELTFKPGPGGLTIAEIANRHAHASVALQGGHVLAFQPRGQQPVLWVSKRSYYAAGKAIRGGIPVCWPWFSVHATDSDKPAHGFARTSLWSVLGADVTAEDVTRLRLGLTDSDATRAIWPHAFRLELTVAVGPVLEVELLIRNPGPTAFTCTGALHSYFAVSDIAVARIHGLDRCAYLDKVARYERFEQAGPIVVCAETDRIYLDTTADCLIADAGWERTIRVGKQGSRTTVVWNPWADKARQFADFGDDEYREMVCVETTNAADDQITVPPLGEHRLSTTLAVETIGPVK